MKLFNKILLMVLSIVIGALGLMNSTEVKAEKDFIIATDTTFAPFEFRNANDELVGIDMDLLEAIAEDQGFTYKIRPLGFNAAVQALEANQADAVIAAMTITEERKKSFDFSDPYYEGGLSFGVAAGSSYQSLDDLRGKTIAVKNGTAGADYIERHGDQYDFKVSVFEDTANMYEDVIAGNSDATIEDFAVMAYAITQGLDVRIITDQLETGEYGMAVNKDQNGELLAMFNAGLANMMESGQYDDIVNEYVGDSAMDELEVAAASGGFFSQLKANWSPLMSGLKNTLWITFISIAIAMIIGILLGLMRTSQNVLLETVSLLYIDLMRGVPLVVLAFFVYFGIPQMFDVRLSATIAGIITLSLNGAAYIAEIVRGGIQAVDHGQSQAGRSLGLSYGQTMRHIILPQAFRIMIPSFVNQFVITLKDTSILSIIGLVELTQTGKLIIARTYQSGTMWLIVGAIYLIVITLLTRLSVFLERGNSIVK